MPGPPQTSVASGPPDQPAPPRSMRQQLTPQQSAWPTSGPSSPASDPDPPTHDDRHRQAIQTGRSPRTDPSTIRTPATRRRQRIPVVRRSTWPGIPATHSAPAQTSRTSIWAIVRSATQGLSRPDQPGTDPVLPGPQSAAADGSPHPPARPKPITQRPASPRTHSTNSRPNAKNPGSAIKLNQGLCCTPDGIRTHATGVRGRRPRPLDDGGLGTFPGFRGFFLFSCERELTRADFPPRKGVSLRSWGTRTRT